MITGSTLMAKTKPILSTSASPPKTKPMPSLA